MATIMGGIFRFVEELYISYFIDNLPWICFTLLDFEGGGAKLSSMNMVQ